MHAPHFNSEIHARLARLAESAKRTQELAAQAQADIRSTQQRLAELWPSAFQAKAAS